MTVKTEIGTHNDLRDALHLLKAAASLIENAIDSDESEIVDMYARSAAWRMADAAGLFRLVMEHEKLMCMGVNAPTGRGFMLPVAA